MKCQLIMLQARSVGRRAIDLWHETSGAVAIEYGLIAALIALAIIGSIIQLGESVADLPMQSLIDAFAGALS